MNLRVDNRTPLNYRHKPLTQPIWKNNRLSWSPQLHARFVETLHLLGGMYGTYNPQNHYLFPNFIKYFINKLILNLEADNVFGQRRLLSKSERRWTLKASLMIKWRATFRLLSKPIFWYSGFGWMLNIYVFLMGLCLVAEISTSQPQAAGGMRTGTADGEWWRSMEPGQGWRWAYGTGKLSSACWLCYKEYSYFGFK